MQEQPEKTNDIKLDRNISCSMQSDVASVSEVKIAKRVLMAPKLVRKILPASLF